MRLLKVRKAQSMIEYAILLAIVISAFLLLQGIVKRGVQGSLNDAAGRMGDQYSVTGTTTSEGRARLQDASIVEETGTSAGDIPDEFLEGPGSSIVAADIVGTVDKGAHNRVGRFGESFGQTNKSLTETVDLEGYRQSDLDALSTPVTDYENPEP